MNTSTTVENLSSPARHLQTRRPQLIEQEESWKGEVLFTRGERRALLLLVVSLIIQVTWFSGSFYGHEIVMAGFVFLTRKRLGGVSRLAPLFVALAVPLAFALIFPSDNRLNFDLRRMMAVLAKLYLFVLFIQSLTNRCRNHANAIWFARNVILPVALILGISAIIDRYTNTTFFINWHDFWGTRAQSTTLLDLASDPLAFDVGRVSGFATRNYDAVVWAFLGVLVGYWLRQCGVIKPRLFLVLAATLLFSIFSLPQRSALVIVGLAVVAVLWWERERSEARWKLGLSGLVALIIVVTTILGDQYDATIASQFSTIDATSITALSRTLSLGIIDETRFKMIHDELDNFSIEPRLLLIGSGWNFSAGTWSKPHNTYLALIIGGGIPSLIFLIFFVIGLARQARGLHPKYPSAAIGIALLIALSVDLFDNGYLFTGLEYPAGILTIWIGLAVIILANPPQFIRITE